MRDDTVFAKTEDSKRLRTRFGFIFAILAVSSIALCVTVVHNLRHVQTDGRRFIEETREARLVHDLRWTLERLVERVPDEYDSEEGKRRVIRDARAVLEEIFVGPRRGTDPSRREHQSEEDRIEQGLEDCLVRLDAMTSGPPGSQDEVDVILGRMQSLIQELEEETEEEARNVAVDLETRVENLVVVMIGTVLGTFILLYLVFRIVRREVLLPVERLTEGAARFGRGDLSHRIDIRSRDEIGDLATEFNRMAANLREMHAELENRVEQRTRQLIRATRLADLGTFAAGVAHEVNTPLASIASSAEGLERRLLKGELAKEEQLEYLKTIASEAYRAHEITARLLAFARSSPGVASPLRIDESIREVIRLLRHKAETDGVEIELQAEVDVPPVLGNDSELRQVVVNLLKNALDSSSRGDRVTITVSSDEERVVVEVRDRGTGISDENMKHIFDPFFTTKEAGKGTGLGLSIAYRIVEDHGGRLDAWNHQTGGAVFAFTIPRAGVEDDTE